MMDKEQEPGGHACSRIILQVMLAEEDWTSDGCNKLDIPWVSETFSASPLTKKQADPD